MHVSVPNDPIFIRGTNVSSTALVAPEDEGTVVAHNFVGCGLAKMISTLPAG